MAENSTGRFAKVIGKIGALPAAFLLKENVEPYEESETTFDQRDEIVKDL